MLSEIGLGPVEEALLSKFDQPLALDQAPTNVFEIVTNATTTEQYVQDTVKNAIELFIKCSLIAKCSDRNYSLTPDIRLIKGRVPEKLLPCAKGVEDIEGQRINKVVRTYESLLLLLSNGKVMKLTAEGPRYEDDSPEVVYAEQELSLHDMEQLGFISHVVVRAESEYQQTVIKYREKIKRYRNWLRDQREFDEASA